MTVAEFMARWLEAVRHQVSWNTYRGYEQRTRTHIVPDLGHLRLLELRPLHVEEAQRRWLASGNRRTGGPLDPRTVLHLHRVLHLALERAVKWRLLPLNPMEGVEPPSVPRKEQGFLTAAEAERLVAALAGDEYELPILVGLYCGLRPAEYLALRWRDLDLERGELRVMQSVQRVRRDQVSEHLGRRVEGFRFGPTKTHRSRRPVAMPPVLVELLQDWRLRQALERAGVWRVVLYALRHTMATLVLHETKDLKPAARLGHADETLALRTYGHLLPGLDRAAADRLGEVVRRPVQHERNKSNRAEGW